MAILEKDTIKTLFNIHFSYNMFFILIFYAIEKFWHILNNHIMFPFWGLLFASFVMLFITSKIPTTSKDIRIFNFKIMLYISFYQIVNIVTIYALFYSGIFEKSLLVISIFSIFILAVIFSLGVNFWLKLLERKVLNNKEAVSDISTDSKEK